jgi:ethanolamine ammonia-lyase large subunit
MSLPTKNDPMLGYMTTSFQDHVRLRSKHGLKINEKMVTFFQRIGILDDKMHYTKHAGDPVWVYYQYCKARGDLRPEKEIMREGRAELQHVLDRGIHISEGHGENVWDMNPTLKNELDLLYATSKTSLHSHLSDDFLAHFENKLVLTTCATNKEDHINFPRLGEHLSPESIDTLEKIEAEWKLTLFSRLFLSEYPEIQIVVSDGLNANAISDEGHLKPYLDALLARLEEEKMKVSPRILFLVNGRVRAGYQVGHILFRNSTRKRKTVIHIIGERPGTLHNNYSVYIAAPPTKVWRENKMDHNMAKLISGISDTSLCRKEAAARTVLLMKDLMINEELDEESEALHDMREKQELDVMYESVRKSIEQHKAQDQAKHSQMNKELHE